MIVFIVLRDSYDGITTIDWITINKIEAMKYVADKNQDTADDYRLEEWDVE